MAAVFLCALSCYGTTVIVIRSPDGILLAADAKATHKGSNLAPQCKIHRYGKVFVVMAGITTSVGVGLEPEQLARTVFTTSGPILTQMEGFAIATRKYLLAQIDSEKNSNRPYYERNYLGKSILDVTFASMSSPNPEVIVETFFVDGVGVLHDQRTPLGNHLLLVSGMTSAIKSYTQQNGGWYKQLGPDVAIKKFMDLEIASKENAAGPPASILKMDVGGVRWVEPGACPAILK